MMTRRESDAHWFQPVAAHLREAYWAPGTGRVMAFTKGTAREVAFLWDELELAPGARVLDVGCGPGRHALALAERGAEVVGIDISEDFVELARGAAADQRLSGIEFRCEDARHLDAEAEFDAAISLCQGAFGLLGRDGPGADEEMFERIVRAVVPGGRVAVSAFSAYFAVRHLEEGESFDASRGVNHEVARVRGSHGDERPFDLWTTCFTPRELRLLASTQGLEHVHVYGEYTREPPALDHREFVVVGTRRR